MFIVSNLKMPVNCSECPLDPSACTLWTMVRCYDSDPDKFVQNRHPRCPLQPVKAVITEDDIRLEIRELDI